jgi:hypothetical protein
MNIRNAAGIAFVASLLSVVPAWQGMNRLIAIGATRSRWWIPPSIALLGCLLVCFLAIMPVFYFALYRHRGPIRFPTPLRKLALAAAAILVAVMILRFQASSGGWNWNSVLALVANGGYILLLVAMSRDIPDELSEPISVSRLLAAITKLAVIAWGLWVAFQFVRLTIVALTYGQVKQIAFQVGHDAPPLRDMLKDVTLTLFSQAGLLAAPYIVWRSGLANRDIAGDIPAGGVN